MKSFVAVVLVGCLVVASLAQVQQPNAVPAQFIGGAPAAEFAPLMDEDTTGARNKRQFGYGGYGGGYGGRGFGGGGYGGRGFGGGYGGGYGGYGGYGR